MTEAEILKSIKTNLQLFCPEVIWIDRLQSGKIQSGRYWVQMCKAGTPDLYAILNINKGMVLFIECKRSVGGSQSDDQKIFEHKIIDLKNVRYMVARSIGEVIDFIKKLDKSKK